jgi:hypothetical protein
MKKIMGIDIIKENNQGVLILTKNKTALKNIKRKKKEIIEFIIAIARYSSGFASIFIFAKFSSINGKNFFNLFATPERLLEMFFKILKGTKEKGILFFIF